jgi:hypothetical protein
MFASIKIRPSDEDQITAGLNELAFRGAALRLDIVPPPA